MPGLKASAIISSTTTFYVLKGLTAASSEYCYIVLNIPAIEASIKLPASSTRRFSSSRRTGYGTHSHNRDFIAGRAIDNAQKFFAVNYYKRNNSTGRCADGQSCGHYSRGCFIAQPFEKFTVFSTFLWFPGKTFYTQRRNGWNSWVSSPFLYPHSVTIEDLCRKSINTLLPLNQISRQPP